VRVSRRDFLKYCLGSAATLGLSTSVLGNLEKVFATGGGPPIIWLSGASCTGCTVSLANLASVSKPTDAADLLINSINLAYHPNLMGAAGDLAVSTLRGVVDSKNYILAVEGGIPTAFNGYACVLWTEKDKNNQDKEVTALEAVTSLAQGALLILGIGSCASFGGIPSGKPNPTQIKSVKAVTGKSTINIPGCPAHPDWVVGTIAQLLGGVTPKLDSYGRPTAYFPSNTVHDRCPRNGRDWALNFGIDDLCLQGLGCKGISTHADCPSRQWNNQANWCVGANSICLGCTESTFPDGFSPFFSATGALPRGHERVDTNKTCIQCHGSSPGEDD
jgi:hydrogenase small subunit